ncbi:MAG: phosphate/phosphite/phosphonate ABC transporter substrate-binding protein [Gammaproteobacteria bacterium]|nr:phosphate/phosphite/phosphonate ABC transporter substrate-binding protein [Gammaproteobacteria bacterium]MDH5651791.1 phosphate/phosphite/phosphonate ABC transporter substrate-binding protein [Gammaproteobacteria bacterium]
MHRHFKLAAAVVLLGYITPVSATAEDKQIIIAVRAHSGEQHAIKKWQPTVDRLNQSIPGFQFRLQPYTSLKQQRQDGEWKKYHFVLTNPATYIALEKNAGAKALLTLINDRTGMAQSRFGSVIFTHVDHSDIVSLKDLSGKNFMGVNPLGFGGWLVALHEFRKQGIEPRRDFASLQFAGNQPDVVYAVRDKKVHAGVVRTDMLERLAAKGRIQLTSFRILNQQENPDFPFFHSTPLYPEWPFAVMPHTAPELSAQVKQVLASIHRADVAAKAGKYMGWEPALDYQPVKQLMQALGVEPFARKTILSHFSGWSGGIIVLIITMAVLLYIFRKKIR